MAFAHNNALYGSSLTTPLPVYDAVYGSRFNAAFSPATSPTESAVARAPAADRLSAGTDPRCICASMDAGRNSCAVSQEVQGMKQKSQHLQRHWNSI